MKANQYHYIDSNWNTDLPTSSPAQLLMVFGSRDLIQSKKFYEPLQVAFPNASIMGCTTSGEIKDVEIYDDSVVVNELFFEKTDVETRGVHLDQFESLGVAVDALISDLPTSGLKHVLVISDGQNVNGTELANSLMHKLPSDVTITGGLAGDAYSFSETIVWHNNDIGSNRLVICGFYGQNIEIGHGSLGGWVPFGPDRLITKSEANVLFELDNQSALSLYKEYLGDFANELPASALRFPLCIKNDDTTDFTVRTILNIDEETNSLIFAGDIPEGKYAKLMRANTGKLVDGAESAATRALTIAGSDSPDFALLISCVGRRLVLQQESEYELESVQEVLGDNCVLGGFYSYGELSPIGKGKRCVLHNQTMTVTTFKERI